MVYNFIILQTRVRSRFASQFAYGPLEVPYGFLAEGDVQGGGTGRDVQLSF